MEDFVSAIQSIYNFRIVGQYLDEFARGIGNTVSAAAFSLVFSLFFGLVLALMRISGRRFLSYPASVYIQVIRSTPLLLQIYIVYFGLPAIFPSMGRLPEVILGVIALTLHTGAYMGEIIRSGLLSVPIGQREGAVAVGMSTFQQYRYVILPQGIVNIIPTLLGQTAILIKDTSLLSLITVFDLVSAGMRLNSDRVRPNEAFLTIAAIYFAIYLLVLFFSRMVEERLAGRGWRVPA